MKTKIILIGVLLLQLSFAGLADDNGTNPPKPYPLKTCLVCDMQLADMGKPYVFVYQGQEIKVCSKFEEGIFDKKPDKYMKKLAEEAAKTRK